MCSRFLVVVVPALLAGLVLAAEPAPLDEAATKVLLQTPIGFRPAMFEGETFPEVHLDAAALEKVLGPFRTKVVVHNRTREEEKAEKAGPYFAVVTLTPKNLPALTRYVTIVRLAKKPADDWKFDPAAPEELATLARVPVERVKEQARLLADLARNRPFAELKTDPRFVAAVAGLSVTPPVEKSPVTRQNNALAQERGVWVTIRRRLAGLNQQFPGAVSMPDTVQDKESPEVRKGTPAEAGFKPDAAAKIDAVLTEWAETDDQAFAVCIVRHGVIVLHKAYGTRDGKPMTVDSPSWMASVTKPMSATLMMMLVDRGLVKLDDPVDKFVPALRGLRPEKPLRIRHLYTHTNGLEKLPLSDDTLPDLEERLALVYPHIKVGEAWAYNGCGYAVGGKIIETVTGEAMPRVYEHHLLGPLEMTRTEVVGTHADAYSVPLDMAKFGQMLLNKGQYGQMRFMKPETFAQMLPRKLTEELGPGATKTFGIGLDGTPSKFGHGAASAATFSVDVENDLVVVMTRNKMGKVQDRYNGKFWDAIKAGMEGGK
jgi:CubicO group peptidase (beta-lactamase class C family)